MPTLNSIEKELAAGKVIIVPQEQAEVLDWQGSGYIVLDPETMAGAYKIEGGLNGGNCSAETGLAFVVWPYHISPNGSAGGGSSHYAVLGRHNDFNLHYFRPYLFWRYLKQSCLSHFPNKA